jgi:hypothetical protein
MRSWAGARTLPRWRGRRLSHHATHRASPHGAAPSDASSQTPIMDVRDARSGLETPDRDTASRPNALAAHRARRAVHPLRRSRSVQAGGVSCAESLIQGWRGTCVSLIRLLVHPLHPRTAGSESGHGHAPAGARPQISTASDVASEAGSERIGRHMRDCPARTPAAVIVARSALPWSTRASDALHFAWTGGAHGTVELRPRSRRAAPRSRRDAGGLL